MQILYSWFDMAVDRSQIYHDQGEHSNDNTTDVVLMGSREYPSLYLIVKYKENQLRLFFYDYICTSLKILKG